MTTAEVPEPEPARPPASHARAFVVTAVLATVTSGCIGLERLSAGRPEVGVLANVVVTLAAVLALGSTGREGHAPQHMAHFLAAVFGVALVHVAIHLRATNGAGWLVERPAQLVNDAVAVGALLMLLSACAPRLSVRGLVAVLAILALYRLTGRFWHLDVPPQGFDVRVQDLVVAQCAAAALALGLYTGMTRHAF